MSDPNVILLTILDKEYRVTCTDAEEAGLTQAAACLDHHMRHIRDAGRVTGLDRIAILAALQMGVELLQENAPAEPSPILVGRLEQIIQKLDTALETALVGA
jgi:cell division protein ZapA